MDPEKTELILQVKPLRIVITRHGRPTTPENSPGAGSSFIIRIGFSLPALPLLIDAPIVEDTRAAREVGLERGGSNAGAHNLDLADKDPQSLAERGIVEQATIPARTEATQKQDEP